jgi:predicted transcriptional regulator
MGWMTEIQLWQRGSFFVFTTVQTGSGVLGVKWSGHDADHISTSSADVKNEWSCTFTPYFIFMVWCLIMQCICLYDVVLRNFTFILKFLI